jgi:hypothetical protein
MIVTVQVRPDGRIRVEIFPSVSVAQNRALARDNDQGFMVQPVAHLGERMPDELAIELADFVHL